MTSGIYAITNTVTGEQYIGASKQIEVRWVMHQSGMKNCSYSTSPRLIAAWKEYGADALKLEVLEETNTDLRERELYYLRRRFAERGSHELNGSSFRSYPTTNGEGSKRRISVTTYLDEDLRDMLHQLAIARYGSASANASQVLRDLIREAYEQQETRP